MENEEKKEDGKACCSKGKCCGKAFGAAALLVVGLVGGFFLGRHCGSGMCPFHSSSAPAAAAPASPAPTPAK